MSLNNPTQADIRSSVDGNIRLENTFTIASMNVMWAVVAGSRIERGDPQKLKMVNAVSGFLRSSTGTNILNALPLLRFIAPKLTGYDKLIYHVNLIRDYLQVPFIHSNSFHYFSPLTALMVKT